MADGLGADVLQELDTLLLEQAREGKVTAAVALYRHVQARLKGEAKGQPDMDSSLCWNDAGDLVLASNESDRARSVREIISELEAEIAALKDQLKPRV